MTQSQLSLSKKITVSHGFTQTDAGDFECEYTLSGQHKIFHRSPLAMANLLKESGFIDSYNLTTCAVYVKYEANEEGDTTEQIEILEDFVLSLSQFHALLIITEIETREENRRERATAFQFSCDKHLFEKVIN